MVNHVSLFGCSNPLILEISNENSTANSNFSTTKTSIQLANLCRLTQLLKPRAAELVLSYPMTLLDNHTLLNYKCKSFADNTNLFLETEDSLSQALYIWIKLV